MSAETDELDEIVNREAWKAWSRGMVDVFQVSEEDWVVATSQDEALTFAKSIDIVEPFEIPARWDEDDYFRHTVDVDGEMRDAFEVMLADRDKPVPRHFMSSEY